MNPLSGYSWPAAAYTVGVAALSFVLLYARTKGWGVEFETLAVVREAIARGGRARRIRLAAHTGYNNFVKLERAGAYCHDDLHLAGRGMVLYGFGGLALFSTIGFIAHQAGLQAAIPPTLALQALSSTVFGAGGLLLLGRRLANPNRRMVTPPSTAAIQALIFLFGGVSAASATLGITGPTPASTAAHLATLTLFGAFMLYAPFTEITFLLWKGSHLVLEELRAQEEAARRGAPVEAKNVEIKGG